MQLLRYVKQNCIFMHLSVTRRLLPVERRKYYTVDLFILFYHLAWRTQEIIFMKYNE